MLTWAETAGLIILVIVILPLLPSNKVRYYGCYIFYIFTVSTLGLAFVPIFIFRPKNPVNLLLASRYLKHLTSVMGIEWEIRRGEVLADRTRGGAVVCMNHQTIIDIMGLFNIWDWLGVATVVAKKELLFVPPFGVVAWLAGLTYIDRSNAKLANTQISSAASTALANNVHLCLFPEGTRNKSGEKLLPFKKGAFRVALQSQSHIIPVVFSPYYFIDSKNKTFARGKVIVSVLDPINTDGMTLDDMDTLMDKTYTVMSDEFQRLAKEVAPFKKLHSD